MDLINRIIEISTDIYSSIGSGYNEVIYHKAFEVALRLNNIPYQSEVIIPVMYKGYNVGHGRADLIIGSNIIIELKAISNFNSDTINTQIKNYMSTLNINEGLVINFGQSSKVSEISIKYIINNNNNYKIYKYLNGSFQNSEINIT